MGKVYTGVQINPNGNRKTSSSKDGKHPIYVMVKEGRKKERIPVNHRVDPANFEHQAKKNQWVKSGEPNARLINALINKIKSTIDNELGILELQDKRKTPKQIKEWYLKTHDKENQAKKETELTFVDFFEEYITKERKGKRYKSVLSKLQAFDRPVGFYDMERDYFKSLSNFLKSDPEHGIFITSAGKYFAIIKQVYIEWCLVLNEDRYQKMRYFEGITFSTKTKTKAWALSSKELERLKELKFDDTVWGKKREAVRDVFIFMCYTSRYLSEIKSLTFEENFFTEGKEGDKLTIKSSRSKTDVFFENAITPQFIVDIFWKHNPTAKEQFSKGQKPKGPFFPVIDYSQLTLAFNYHLERFSKQLDLSFTMTVKTARRTFKTTVGGGLDPSRIMKILGHTNIRTQEIYVGQDSNPLHDVMEKYYLNK